MTRLAYIVIILAGLAAAGLLIAIKTPKKTEKPTPRQEAGLSLTPPATPQAEKAIQKQSLALDPTASHDDSNNSYPSDPIESLREDIQKRQELYQINFSTEEREKINQLLAERGIFTNITGYFDPIYDSYFEYDNATLQAMAAHNDMRALSILAFRAQQSDNYEEAKKYHVQAAILGSVEDIKEIQKTYDIKLSEKLRQEAPEIFETLWLEKLAWGKVYEKRGGYIDESTAGFSPKKLSSQEKEKVKQLAETFYANLESERQKKGLTSFDNEIPELLQEYRDLIYGPSY